MNDYFSSFLNAVSNELEKANKGYLQAKKAAIEIAASASLSPSQAGDRYHSQATADLAKQKYESVLKLKNELEVKKEKVLFQINGETVFVVDNPILIDGFKIISSKSPKGIEILSR